MASTVSIEGALRSGEVFARRYAVERQLGRGAMGEVWAARDLELDVMVALKVLRPTGVMPVELADRFRREVRLARRVTHRNAARAYDIGHAAGLLYLTMELVDGPSLARVLAASRTLAVDRVVDLGIQLCDGLAAAHEAGVVHRDLKPANIVVETSGRAVITDFGVARGLWDDPMATVDGSLVVGTPSYMAPEQRAGQADARADLFALGVILFEALTGSLPHDVDAGGWPLDAGGADEVRARLSTHGAPEALATVVIDCLQTAASARPSSARRVRTRLAKLGPGRTLGASSVRFATLDPGPRTLAVLPMRYSGAPEESWLAEVLGSELVDVLAMTRGMRVCAAPSRRDPREVGRDLGADTVVDASIQRFADRIRITARLVDTESAEQTFSERFEAGLGAVVEIQDRLARRIAEVLRQELQLRRDRGSASDEAIDLYLRARWQCRAFDLGGDGPEGAVALFERCLELAPSFRPAVAAMAAAYGRMLFTWHAPDETRDWSKLCADSVARAQREAPELPETQLAVARMHTQSGHYREAAAALRRALDLAPTCAAAHGLLGTLQCEAGLAEQGIQHIELARELDPRERWATTSHARHLALRGDHTRCRRLLDQLRVEVPDLAGATESLAARFAVWRRDRESLRASYEGWPADRPASWRLRGIFGFALGQVSPADHAALIEGWVAERSSVRARSLILQVAVEVVAMAGDLPRAMGYLQRIADDGLVDLDWLELCPGLAPLRALSEWPAVVERVRQRAAAIWTVE